MTKKLCDFLDIEKQEFVITTLLYESARDQKVDNKERHYILSLCKSLQFPQKRFQEIRQLVYENVKNYPNKANESLDLKSFLLLIRERFESQFSRQETDQITKLLIREMDCEKEFLSLFGKEKDTDAELDNLLKEISEKDWEIILEDHKNTLVSVRAHEEALARIEKLGEEKMITGILTGACIGAIFGIFVPSTLALGLLFVSLLSISVSLVLSTGGAGSAAGAAFFALAMLSLSTGGAVISFFGPWFVTLLGMLSTGAIGALLGGALWIRIKKLQMLQKIDEMTQKIVNEKYHSYILEPVDLLNFWDIRVKNYFQNKKDMVSFRIQTATRHISQCQNLLKTMKEVQHSENETDVNELKSQISSMKSIIHQAMKVNQIIQGLENSLQIKVEELRNLVEWQKKETINDYKRMEIRGKLQKLIGKGKKLEKEWEEDKEGLQSQIEGMALAFQSQLLQTKDFVDEQKKLCEL